MPLLPDDLKARLPPCYSQEGEDDPFIHVRFHLPGTGWVWYAIEGEPEGDDFLFFGYVCGLENEFGYFRLSELEQLRSPAGLAVERDETFEPGRLTEVVPAPEE